MCGLAPVSDLEEIASKTIAIQPTNLNLTTILGAIAVLIAAINIAGGFLVTNRMLAMFRK